MPNPRFHDGATADTHAVRLERAGAALQILTQDGALIANWPLKSIQAAPELDPDGVLTLTARDSPGVLSVEDAASLALLRAANIRLPRHRAWTRAHWISVCVSLVAAIGLCGALVMIMPAWLATLIPVSWERAIGGPTEALMTASHTKCTSEAGQAALDRLVSRLRTAGKIAMPVTLTVMNDHLVNAFTLPGGRVLVMRGLIDKAEDGPELAAVIAHELGHVTHRDTTTLLLRRMGLSALLHMIGLGDAGSTVADGASGMLNLAYGRAAETAADDTAMVLLSTAGLRADGLARFFKHMEEAHPNEDARLTWLSTHPATEERRARTTRPPTGQAPFSEPEWQAIKSMCPNG